MNIITSYFIVKRIPGSTFIGEQSLRYHRERQQEYVDCIAANALHPHVRAIVLLIEGLDGFEHFRRTFTNAPASTAIVSEGCRLPARFTDAHRRKLVPLLYSPASGRTDGRPMPVYGDFFAAAGRLFPGQLCMVSNADVHLSLENFSVPDTHALFKFAAGSMQGTAGLRYGESHIDGESELIANRAKPARLALALTRHEEDSNRPLAAPLITDYRGSHDAFIFEAPVSSSLVRCLGHPQNCYQAENVVIHGLQQHGYRVLNPCKSLRLVHRHAADMRQWLPSIDPSRYGRAEPMTLGQCHAALGNEAVGDPQAIQ